MRDVVKIATFLSIEGCLRDCGRKRRQHSGESRRTENIWLQVEDENEREAALGGASDVGAQRSLQLSKYECTRAWSSHRCTLTLFHTHAHTGSHTKVHVYIYI